MRPLQKDKQNFESAYCKYGDMLYRLALSYMQNKEDAEDVVQDVFTKYVCGIHLPMDETHEKAWFIRVTINQCYDSIRKRNYRMHDSLETVAARTYEQETSRIQDVLSVLPEKYKGVVILHYLEGYSVVEIAKMLRLSESAVKMRLKRGREYLKSEMEKE